MVTVAMPLIYLIARGFSSRYRMPCFAIDFLPFTLSAAIIAARYGDDAATMPRRRCLRYGACDILHYCCFMIR